LLLLLLRLLRQHAGACGRHDRQAKTTYCAARAESMHGASPFNLVFCSSFAEHRKSKRSQCYFICIAITALRLRSFCVAAVHSLFIRRGRDPVLARNAHSEQRHRNGG
jgi:hypothetical protein